LPEAVITMILQPLKALLITTKSPAIPVAEVQAAVVEAAVPLSQVIRQKI